MLTTLPRRRSLAVLVFLSLVMVIGSYLIVLLIAGLCTYLPLWVMLNSDSRAQIIILLLCGLAMSGTMLWSLFPRRDNFKEPGPLINRSQHPELFTELEDIASALNEPLPEEVFLIPHMNAFVTDRGGIMGFGSRRVMGIGLPLIALLNVEEFRAILAHEFAHYYGGDTRLGPFVYKTRMAMVRTIQNMASMRNVMRFAAAAAAYAVVMAILQAYWKLFFRATQLISRRREYRADELACHIAGSEALINGLKKIHGGDIAYPAYWNFEVTPLLAQGYRPPIAEGFAMFASAPEAVRQMQHHLEEELRQNKTTPYDSHPSLRNRIAAAKLLAPGKSNEDAAKPASTLFNDLPKEEIQMLSMSASGSQIAALKPIAWNELPTILPRIWSGTVASNAHLLTDLTPEGVPDIVPKLPEIGSRIPDPKGMLLTPQQRTGRAVELIGTALALAVVRAGWELHMSPGDRYYQLDGERFSVREFLAQLLSKKISREEWLERCRTLKIAGVHLTETSDPRQISIFQ